MKWAIAAPFFDLENIKTASWLEPFVPGNNHEFQLIPRQKPLPKWHDRKSKFTPVDDWFVYMKQASDALSSDAEGVITVFPQVASAVGLQQMFRFSKKPVVAWLFNVGTCSTGLRRKLARLSLSHIDYFVVHTRREIEIYSEWLGLPADRFEFLPYQVPDIPIEYEEDQQTPFITSLGSAHRDFPTLFEAVKKLNIKTVVATGKGAVEGMTIPEQVELPFGISKAECLRLAQQARLNIVPLQPKESITAAGQVTIVEAMIMGRPLIVTNFYGAEDYIIHGETGWLVEPNSLESMTKAIDLLWNDDALRQKLGENARAYALEYFSDPCAGRHLERILNQVAGARKAPSNPKLQWAK
ncbi:MULTISPECIES: glycosyltransferase family 4 protein [Cyanophyceae]|uniref:glycosyltransferase family 4 protein n=1 Tax=Cyanophyceae TaxID=3028117 RepID=UPI001687EB82|nr:MULTISPECIES: glycosyltransferase family 4 protein [Cyanophyceae]MBD1918461.1 glycosyltransferase family 4 protein [Phormidium sp. FACHB-77]MBD2031350.1 glycosyltransferase family 4 protein [Phormidium sp. FACHB-322]MBD2049470.1 glycosyltransferase family 4 protein [Leptolyngbya sp. FACHB-60]